VDGTQGADKVLTSDANGLASWQFISIPPAGWSLTGNAGTVPGTNFIGTTDSIDFDIRTANSVKIRITARGMIEPQNTGNSIFIGSGSGSHDDLTNNQNAFVGTGAGYFNSSGFYNTALGTNALSANSTGFMNTAAGTFALALNSTGNYNTASGTSALYHNSNGNNNVSAGNNSLWNNSTGSNNTANGSNSLFSNTTGNLNTAIGDSSNVASGNLTNATAIGAHALVGADNSLVLGSINGVNGATASTNVGIGTTIPSARLDVVGNVKITDGTQGTGKILTSDANGLASWQTLSNPSAGWSLSGNAGTVNGTNFIGTTDNQGIDFRANNILKTRITTKGAIETYNTGGAVFIGEGAGANCNLTDSRSVFIGFQAGNHNSSGMMNTANGYKSFYSNISSHTNTAFGAYTLYSNSEGWSNTAVGFESLYYNSDGSYNTAVGRGTMYYNTTGSYNSAFGKNALSGNTEGSSNTAIGDEAMHYNNTGQCNTAVGSNALYNNMTGIYNAAFGCYADLGVDGLTNATAIGALSMVNASNSMVLGSIDGVNGANANVNVGIGTTTPGERLDVVGGNIRTSNQFVSSLATGTSPLQVLSNTLVSNLNADLLDGQHATAFAPAAASSNYIQNQTASNQSAGFQINGNGIFNGGKIGIGTTNPTGNLQIDNTGDVTLVLNADTDNAAGESDNPRIELHQDGGGVVGAMGLTGSADALHLGDIQNAFYLVQEYSEGALQFGTNNQIKMTILPNGYVGIGTNAPKVPLHISTATSTTPFSSTSVNFIKLTPSGLSAPLTGGLNGVNSLVSLVAEGDIICKGTLTVASAIYFSSDKRIKDISGQSNSLKDLDILNKIQVTDYMMKDKVTWGFASYKKAIAQQVEEVYPQAVTKTTGFIPDVYEFASKVEKTETGYLITMGKPLNCAESKKVRLELENKGTVEAYILKVLNDNQFEVATETDISTGTLFVYGMQVDDLRTVDYDAISMLNVSATQELAKQLKEAQDRIVELSNQNKELKAQIGEIRDYLEMSSKK
jgi:hypothetical protein